MKIIITHNKNRINLYMKGFEPDNKALKLLILSS